MRDCEHLFRGEVVPTLTNQGLSAGAEALGVSPTVAQVSADIIEIGISGKACIRSGSTVLSEEISSENFVYVDLWGETHRVHKEIAPRLIRMENMNVGYNVSAEHDFLKYTNLGKEFTYLTDVESLLPRLGEKCLGNAKISTGLFRSRNRISYYDAWLLARDIGVPRDVFLRGLRVTRINYLHLRKPTLPRTGNKYLALRQFL